MEIGAGNEIKLVGNPIVTPWGRKIANRNYGIWSGKRDSNSRPQPWQGCALPLSYSRKYGMPANTHHFLNKTQLTHARWVRVVIKKGGIP